MLINPDQLASGNPILLLGVDGPHASILPRDCRYFPIDPELDLGATAFWTTVATGLPAERHGIVSGMVSKDGALRSARLDPAASPVWNRLHAKGCRVAVIGWPGADSSNVLGGGLVTEDLLRGKPGEFPRACGGCLVRPEELHADVLDAVAPRWREVPASLAPLLISLRATLAALYSTHACVKNLLAGSDFVCARYGLPLQVATLFRGLGFGPGCGEILEFFNETPARSAELQEHMIQDLVDFAGTSARFVIVNRVPNDKRGSELSRGRCVVRGALDPDFSGASIRAADISSLFAARSEVEHGGLAPVPGALITEGSCLQEESMPGGLQNLPAWVQAQNEFLLGVAYARAGKTAKSRRLLRSAWSVFPENPAYAHHLAKALRAGTGGSDSAFSEVMGAEGADVTGSFPGGQTDLELRPLHASERDRAVLLFGPHAVSFGGEIHALVRRKKVDSLVAIVGFLPDLQRERLRIQIRLIPAWHARLEAIERIVKGAEAVARRHGLRSMVCEVFNASTLAATLCEAGFSEVRVDERWSVPFPNLLARVVAAWDAVKRRYAPNLIDLKDEPGPDCCADALAIARAHGLSNPRLETCLGTGDELWSVFQRDTSNFVLKDGKLAAVVLSRPLSPSRIFVELRAVAPEFDKLSHILNARVMLRPLSLGLKNGLNSLELLARRREERETISLARRSGGHLMEVRRVLKMQLPKPEISPLSPAQLTASCQT